VNLIHCFATAFDQSYNRMMAKAKGKPTPDRVIGILGGMGPEATLDLYRHIIGLTPAAKDQDHIRILIYSNPKIPDRTQAIAGDGESPLRALIESASILEKGGAGIIAMPCNTAHYFLPQMRQEIGIPILDMIAETCSRLREHLPEARTVGLIAAIGTVLSGVYHRALAGAGIEVLIPSAADQQKIQNAIAHVKAGVHNRSTQETFQSIGMRLIEKGAEAVILGCTEVPLAFDPEDVDYLSLNSTRILAEAAVDWALGKRR
jgi:aspartate racemase